MGAVAFCGVGAMSTFGRAGLFCCCVVMLRLEANELLTDMLRPSSVMFATAFPSLSVVMYKNPLLKAESCPGRTAILRLVNVIINRAVC